MMQRQALFAVMATVTAIVASIFIANHSVVHAAPYCPNQCSDHGYCTDTGCICQVGFTRDDCSQKMCPMGKDPLSAAKNHRTIRFTTAVSYGRIAGKMKFTFSMDSVYFFAHSRQFDGAACTQALGKLTTIRELVCIREDYDPESGTGSYLVVIKSFPLEPFMNNLHYHTGNPPLSMFGCGHPDDSEVTCTLTDVVADDVVEYDTCSGRGVCDGFLGKCICSKGFKGDACDDNTDTEDKLVAYADSPFFTGTALRVRVDKLPSDDFFLLRAASGSDDLFAVAGNGTVFVPDGHLDIQKGDILVGNGKIQVPKGYITVGANNEVLENPALQVYGSATFAGSASTSPVLAVGSTSPDFASTILEISASILDEATGEAFFLKAVDEDGTLFSVDMSGTTKINRGGLEVEGGAVVGGKGIFVKSGGITVQGDGLRVEDSDLSVRGGILEVLLDEDSPKQAAVIVERKNAKAGDSLLQLQTTQLQTMDAHSYFLRAMSNGQPTVDIASSGRTTIHNGGLRVASGGIQLENGGIAIASGGLEVAKGGIVISQGGLTIANDGFDITDGGLFVQNSAIAGPVLEVRSSSLDYVGSHIVIDAMASEATAGFTFLDARLNGTTYASLKGDGTLTTTGDLVTLGSGRIIAEGDLVAKGRLILSHSSKTPDATSKSLESDMALSTENGLLILEDDGRNEERQVRLLTNGAQKGQFLIVQNNDKNVAVDTTNEVALPSESSSALLYDGQRWRPITATAFGSGKISDLKELKAGSNLDIGPYSFKADDLLIRSRVPKGDNAATFITKSGRLTNVDAITYDTGLNTLHVPGVRTSRIEGTIDASNSEMMNLNVKGGELRGVSIDAERISCNSTMTVSNGAYIMGYLTVQGPVMGSGAYIDSSDSRLKRDIEPLASDSSLEKIRQLQGVSYIMKNNNQTKQQNSTTSTSRKELGFIAQDVEKILPELVYTDQAGYKALAYSRVTAVLVEAMKAQADSLERCVAESSSLSNKVKSMEKKLHMLELRLNSVLQAMEHVSAKRPLSSDVPDHDSFPATMTFEDM